MLFREPLWYVLNTVHVCLINDFQEYTLQYIKQVIADLGTPKECRDSLIPIKLPNVYEIDGNFFKTKQSTGPARPRKAPAEKKEQKEGTLPRLALEIAEKFENYYFSKKKPVHQVQPDTLGLGYHHRTHVRPTQLAAHLPPQLQPMAPIVPTRLTSLCTARHSFSHSLKSATEFAGKEQPEGIQVPSVEMLNRQIPKLLQSASVESVRPSTSGTSTIATTNLQEVLREEEEAAAALFR